MNACINNKTNDELERRVNGTKSNNKFWTWCWMIMVAAVADVVAMVLLAVQDVVSAAARVAAATLAVTMIFVVREEEHLTAEKERVNKTWRRRRRSRRRRGERWYNFRYGRRKRKLLVLISHVLGLVLLLSVTTSYEIFKIDTHQEQHVRRRLGSCSALANADDSSLAASGGWNVWSASCELSSQRTVSGATLKLKKDPAMGEDQLMVDRQATSVSPGRHFFVRTQGILEVDGITLTGGYGSVRSPLCYCYFIFLNTNFFSNL